jgi:hypothetical protein
MTSATRVFLATIFLAAAGCSGVDGQLDNASPEPGPATPSATVASVATELAVPGAIVATERREWRRADRTHGPPPAVL